MATAAPLRHRTRCCSTAAPPAPWAAKNLAVDGRCSVLIFHPETPDYYVEIRGTALTEPDHEYAFAGRLGERYHTNMRSFDSADARRLRIAIEPKIVVTDARG